MDEKVEIAKRYLMPKAHFSQDQGFTPTPSPLYPTPNVFTLTLISIPTLAVILTFILSLWRIQEWFNPDLYSKAMADTGITDGKVDSDPVP